MHMCMYVDIIFANHIYIYVFLVYSGTLPTESRLDPFVSLIDRQLDVFGLKIQEPRHLRLFCKEHNES